MSLLYSFEYCGKEEWMSTYSYESMRAAFCNVPLNKKIFTKVN